MEDFEQTVLVTGSNGFIGGNLVRLLTRQKSYRIQTFTRLNASKEILNLTLGSRIICHIAGVNRPQNNEEFVSGNLGLTRDLCNALEYAHAADGKLRTLIYTSSVRSGEESDYGWSKKKALEVILSCAERIPLKLCIYPLPGVFGPGSKPFYNSVVATFCFSALKGLPLRVDNPDSILKLTYVGDVINSMVRQFRTSEPVTKVIEDFTSFEISIGDLATTITRLVESKRAEKADERLSEFESKLAQTLNFFSSQLERIE